MGQVHRHLGNCVLARCLYQSYLNISEDPEGVQLANLVLEEMSNCSAEPQGEDELVGTDQALAVSRADAAMRAARPPPLPALPPPAAPSPATELSESDQREWGVSRTLALSAIAGLAANFAVIDFVQAWRLDGQIANLPSTSPQIRSLRRRGSAAQTRARIIGGAALGLGIATALDHWWPELNASSPPAGHVRGIQPRTSLHMGPGFAGLELLLAF